MVRVKRYIETDVLTEAKARIHHIFDIFDSVAVMFSGGKDSLVVLHLAHEVMQERGITTPLDVVFRDEELIPDEVIDFVDHYRQQSWVNMVWFTVPLASTKYVMGVSHAYVQWDNAREWVRPKPAWGVSLEPGDDRVFDQYSMDAFTAQRFAGKVASVNKLNENYINAVEGTTRVNLCKPIFDWEENDVFKYFWERGIKYCSLYDMQLFAGNGLRVSTPLHAESAKRFDLIKSTVPDFYQRVTKVFPEMLAHERYFKEMDREAVHAAYGHTYEGVLAWIDEFVTDEKQHALATKRYDAVMQRAVRDPELYPTRYLLTTFMAGGFKREIMPQARKP